MHNLVDTLWQMGVKVIEIEASADLWTDFNNIMNTIRFGGTTNFVSLCNVTNLVKILKRVSHLSIMYCKFGKDCVSLIFAFFSV